MSVLSRVSRLVGWLAAPLLFACSEQTVEVELHSLQASGEVSFVCRSSTGRGVDRSLCPDFSGEGDYRIYALVTQTSTEEVAIIDTLEARVVDIEPSAPGYSFLRVPARPGAIATSPGGAATFVGLEGPDGKSGITAIPTTCLGPPKSDETRRDVTTFPSCHLPRIPGDIAVLVVPPEADGTIRESCDAGSGPESSPLAASRAECPADLTKEHEDEDGNDVGPRGRRKLAVGLGDEIAIIDAQWLLDQTPGSFPECRIEARLPLEVDLGPEGLEQNLDAAPELETPPGCVIERPPVPPRPSSYLPVAGGFAPAGDVLYVADRNAPVIHVLDVSNACAPAELPSLLAMSFENPGREVLTSKIAASPLTPDGRRFVYAVDSTDLPASLMMFDVSPGSTNRTPLVRAGSQLVPEPPDRVRLEAPVVDVAFALRDLEATDPDTGVAESGVKCDPDPRIDADSPGALHRPTADKSRGAQPRLLRGLFGLAMLGTGPVAIIDVDDFDAPCRRYYQTNPGDTEDFRGCSGDDGLPPYLTLDQTENGSATVTNEVSCNIVAPHRLRSSLLGKTNSTDGIGTASLVAFPEFSRETETVDLPPQNQPKLLAVPFDATSPDQAPPAPVVYVGTTQYTTTSTTARLVTDPNVATVPSLTLPFQEPRAQPPADRVTLTYEGAITAPFQQGNIVFDPDDATDPGMRLEDDAAEFCEGGVYDRAMFEELGVSELGVEDTPEARAAFASRHGDYVEITSELLPVEDEYWVSPRLLGCGVDYGVCTGTFGDYESDEPNPNRQLSIVEAYQDRLYVEPVNIPEDADDATREQEKLELANKVECCFPQGVRYRVHARNQWVLVGAASGTGKDVTSRPETLPNGETHFRCVRDCDPTKKFRNDRVFEIATKASCDGPGGTRPCAVGAWQPGDPCEYDACEGDVFCRRTDASLRLPGPGEPGDTGALACIHSGPTSRFAVYRGLAPTERGMQYSWQTSGGFRALFTTITTVSLIVSPQQVDYVPEIQRIAIVDGAQLGLTLVSLDSLRVEEPWPVY
jgi:hypothetical protein